MMSFEGKEDDAWTLAVAGFRQERAHDGSVVTLVGRCSHCGHDMSVPLALRARSGSRVANQRSSQELGKNGNRRFVKVAFCNCEGDHDKRPDGVKCGCGRFGALLIGHKMPEEEKPQRPAGGGQDLRPFVAIKQSRRKASISDVDWERRAQGELGQLLPSARASAEKWTAAVASLTGLFSIALVVKGPEDVTKVTGDVGNALTLGTGALVALAVFAFLMTCGFGLVRRLEGSGGLGWAVGGLAVVAWALLLGVWVQEWSLFTAVMVLLGLGILLAATAIAAGTLAAYGLPSRFAAPSGTILRERHDEQAHQTRNLLRVLLATTTGAMLAIAAAIALTWTNTGAPPTGKLLVMTADNRTYCGDLVSAQADGTGAERDLVVLPEQGKATTIRVDQVRSLAAVSVCGQK